MPLKKGSSKEVIEANIRELIEAGHEPDQAAAIAYKEAGIAKDESIRFALDSVRRLDADGRLHVAVSNISKSTVNPYYGYEIPGNKELGLDANKVYMLYRDAEELERGASTFNNIPLLDRHTPVSADDPKKDAVVGSTGTDAVFEAPYLKNSLVVWDAEAIAGIESREQCELSCSYRYVPIMQPGTFEGQAYDGRMTNIIGNHVAIVSEGRAGPDVLVADSKPEDIDMPKQAFDKAKDEDLEDLKKAEDESEEDKEKAEDEELEEEKKAEDEDSEEPDTADDEDEDDKEKAMDAALKAHEAKIVRRMQSIAQAEKDVAPIIGQVAAMDSAEAVYKMALDAMGADLSDCPKEAYRALFKNLNRATVKSPKLASDAAPTDFWKQFSPSIKLPSRI